MDEEIIKELRMIRGLLMKELSELNRKADILIKNTAPLKIENGKYFFAMDKGRGEDETIYPECSKCGYPEAECECED